MFQHELSPQLKALFSQSSCAVESQRDFKPIVPFRCYPPTKSIAQEETETNGWIQRLWGESLMHIVQLYVATCLDCVSWIYCWWYGDTCDACCFLLHRGELLHEGKHHGSITQMSQQMVRDLVHCKDRFDCQYGVFRYVCVSVLIQVDRHIELRVNRSAEKQSSQGSPLTQNSRIQDWIEMLETKALIDVKYSSKRQSRQDFRSAPLTWNSGNTNYFELLVNWDTGRILDNSLGMACCYNHVQSIRFSSSDWHQSAPALVKTARTLQK